MIQLRCFGSTELARDGVSASDAVRQPKRLAVLAYLAIANGPGLHRRETLLGVFWPELDEAHARNALSRSLSVLRRGLGRGVIRVRGNDEVGIDPARLQVDVRLFEAAIAAHQFEAALDLYRGDLLPGLFISGAGEFERWLERKRAQLRESAAAAAAALCRQAAAVDDAALAVFWGQRATELAPADEALARMLIETLSAIGARSEAASIYLRLTRHLERDFDMQPDSETRQLVESELHGRVRARPATPRSRVTPFGRYAPDDWRRSPRMRH